MTPNQIVSYISEMTHELADLADVAEQPLLAYLLRLAERECETIAVKARLARSSSNVSDSSGLD